MVELKPEHGEELSRERTFQGGPKAILRTWHLRFGRPVDVESRD